MDKKPDYLLRDIGFMLLTWVLMAAAIAWGESEKSDSKLQQLIAIYKGENHD